MTRFASSFATRSLGKATPGERRGVYAQLRQLRKELWEREGKAVDEILSQANIILATNTAADKKLQSTWIAQFKPRCAATDWRVYVAQSCPCSMLR